VGLENLLGVGSKTVVRWEKGTVFQSATADRLMRLILRVPAVMGILASDSLYEPHVTSVTTTVTRRVEKSNLLTDNWTSKYPRDYREVRNTNSFAA
jgi:hypothetical protein